MEKDIKQDVRLSRLYKALEVVEAPKKWDCLTWLSSPVRQGMIARMITAVERIDYHDPDGANSEAIQIVGDILGIDLINNWVPEALLCDGYVGFKSIGKRYGNPDRDMRHWLAISGELLIDIFAVNGKIWSVAVSQITLDWEATRSELNLPPEVPADAKSIMLEGEFVKNSWLVAYLNTNNYELVVRSGIDFWPLHA
jgi:hypothetical protein